MPDNNALHTAAKSGDLAEVQSQVSNFDINAKGEEDGTALYWAAREGYADVVKLLLTFDPGVNIPDVSTLTKIIPIHLICTSSIPILYLLHFSSCIVISHSRCTTFYRSCTYSILLLVVVLSSLRCPIPFPPQHPHT